MTGPGYRWQVAALCSGYGGLELALTEAGLDHDLAWWSEIDPHAAQVMGAHTEAPNLGDLCAIADPPPVDIVTAGFPCQPVSTAGQRAGVDDSRWIIDAVCRAARSTGARWLILENVAGLLTANGGDAMARVCAAMAEAGFSRWEWATLRAADVGACHLRERWFCVAHAVGEQPERWGGPDLLAGTQGLPRHQDRSDPDQGRPAPGHRRATAAHAGRIRCEGQRLSEPGIPIDTAQRGRDADRCGSARFGGYAPAVERWAHVIGRPAPDPTIDGRLSPLFVEWMMGLPTGWVTDCGLSRTQALRVLGNGVVPQQAAAAIGILCAA
jgi:DNA (cytosine-5)-methyltransferase 1